VGVDGWPGQEYRQEAVDENTQNEIESREWSRSVRDPLRSPGVLWILIVQRHSALSVWSEYSPSGELLGLRPRTSPPEQFSHPDCRAVLILIDAPQRRLIGKLGKPEQLRVCYEAGPTGYVLYWQLTQLGVHCEVVAPTRVPVKAGDRVKTDRSDAEKLARCHRAGDLTAVWVADAAHEALRDRVRARLAAKRDQLRARHRLGEFLLRQGRRAPEGMTAWTSKYLLWVKQQRFEHSAQEVTLLDYLHEVEHAAERIARLERAIDVAVESRLRASASGDRRAAEPARGRQGLGRDAGERARAALAL